MLSVRETALQRKNTEKSSEKTMSDVCKAVVVLIVLAVAIIILLHKGDNE